MSLTCYLLCQHGGVVFASDPSLRFGLAPEIVRIFGRDNRHALLLTDPTMDPYTVLAPFFDPSVKIETIVRPIDPRLSCGDVNQLIARCCPRTLIIPEDYLNEANKSTDTNSATDNQEPDRASSHFSRVFGLHELIAAKSKTELVTLPMRLLEPVGSEKPSKYIEGKLEPNLAIRCKMTEMNGKAAALVKGVLNVRHGEYFLRSKPTVTHKDMEDGTTNESYSRTENKRKLLSEAATSGSVTGRILNNHHLVEYHERSDMLLGQVDEEKLQKQLKAVRGLTRFA